MKWLNRVVLRTPESVELEFVLAGLGNRALAAGVDLGAWLGLLFAYVLLWRLIAAPLLELLEAWLGTDSRADLWLRALQIIGVFLIRVGYAVTFEVLWQGQTPGKRLLQIRVIRDDGRPVGLPQAALRALLGLFDEALLLGAFFIAFGPREKRLGDWVAGTLVVQAERPTSPPVIVSLAAQHLAAELPATANLARLRPEEFATLRRYLQRSPQLLPEARQEKGQQLAAQVRDLVGVATLPEGTTATRFLEAVYWAYQEQRGGDRRL